MARGPLAAVDAVVVVEPAVPPVAGTAVDAEVDVVADGFDDDEHAANTNAQPTNAQSLLIDGA